MWEKNLDEPTRIKSIASKLALGIIPERLTGANFSWDEKTLLSCTENKNDRNQIVKINCFYLEEVEIDRMWEGHPLWPNSVIWSPKNGTHFVYLIYLAARSMW